MILPDHEISLSLRELPLPQEIVSRIFAKETRDISSSEEMKTLGREI